MEELTTESPNQEEEQNLINSLEEINKQSVEEPVNLIEIEQQLSSDYEINVLNLPPRSETHSLKKQKVHFKMSKPFIRLLFVCLLLIIVVGVALYVDPDFFNF